MFLDPQFEPQDWILFSPSHMQIQELGHLCAPNDLNSGKDGATSQSGPNEQDDIAAFLDSVIRDPDEYSDAEVVNALVSGSTQDTLYNYIWTWKFCYYNLSSVNL